MGLCVWFSFGRDWLGLCVGERLRHLVYMKQFFYHLFPNHMFSWFKQFNTFDSSVDSKLLTVQFLIVSHMVHH